MRTGREMKHTDLLTSFMIQVMPWNFYDYSASAINPLPVWKPKVRCPVHISPPLDPILNHLNTVQTAPNSFKIHFKIMFAWFFLSGLFSWDSLIKNTQHWILKIKFHTCLERTEISVSVIYNDRYRHICVLKPSCTKRIQKRPRSRSECKCVESL
jgi:hypothetical protein